MAVETRLSARTQAPLVPVSWGELVDKVTILDIKATRLADPQAVRNVEAERSWLRRTLAEVEADATLRDLQEDLARINAELWDVEDALREKERGGQFDADFVSLARSVYRLNDHRAALKRRINLHLGSALVEEKSYRPY